MNHGNLLSLFLEDSFLKNPQTHKVIAIIKQNTHLPNSQ